LKSTFTDTPRPNSILIGGSIFQLNILFPEECWLIDTMLGSGGVVRARGELILLGPLKIVISAKLVFSLSFGKPRIPWSIMAEPSQKK
jgi:hypothetical protein